MREGDRISSNYGGDIREPAGDERQIGDVTTERAPEIGVWGERERGRRERKGEGKEREIERECWNGEEREIGKKKKKIFFSFLILKF